MDSTKETLKVFCDGGSRGNPGPAAAGSYLELPAENLRLMCGKYLGDTTNNVAEYQGVILGLTTALEKTAGKYSTQVYLDSALVVNQLSGKFRLKAEHLAQLLLKVKEMEQSFSSISYQHVPREQNTQADRAVNLSLDTKSDFSREV